MNPLKSKEFFMAINRYHHNNIDGNKQRQLDSIWLPSWALPPESLVGWFGTVYIALITSNSWQKRKPNMYTDAFKYPHIWQSVAFLLISIHFTSQISRPATAY